MRDFRATARRRFFELREAVRQLGLSGTVKTFEHRGPRFTVRYVDKRGAQDD
jgi:hypothetical protein